MCRDGGGKNAVIITNLRCKLVLFRNFPRFLKVCCQSVKNVPIKAKMLRIIWYHWMKLVNKLSFWELKQNLTGLLEKSWNYRFYCENLAIWRILLWIQVLLLTFILIRFWVLQPAYLFKAFGTTCSTWITIAFLLFFR